MEQLQEKCTEMAFLLGMAVYLITDLSKHILLDLHQRDSIETLLIRIEKICYKDKENAQERNNSQSDSSVYRADSGDGSEDNTI